MIVWVNYPVSFFFRNKEISVMHIERFKNALAAIAQLAEARISVIRLAREIQKTIRRVNALEKVFLPDYRETIKYVEDSLEEADRESFFIMKLVRDRLAARRR